jgi:ParB/RepB/Spo0J family partition protein
MDQMTNQLPLGFVWPTVGHPGMAPIESMMGDPEQPRKDFNPIELEELAATMRAEHGGKQREIITVRAATKEEMLAHPGKRYRIRSGERRWRAAKLVGMPMLEIRVKCYESFAEELLDMWMLNENRKNLSDIENADFLEKLIQEWGWKTQEETAKKIGKDQGWVWQHMSLLKLSPKARALMSPTLAPIDRLKREIGVFMARLSRETQDDFAERMPRGRTSAKTQILWMQEQLKGTSEEVQPVKHRPSVLRQVIGYFADQVERRTTQLAAFDGFERLFENTNPDQVNDLVGKIKDAQRDRRICIRRLFLLYTTLGYTWGYGQGGHKIGAGAFVALSQISTS